MRKLVFILVSILFISCASRKVQINNTEIKTDSIAITKDTIAIKNVDTSYIKNDISIDEIIITPIDSCASFVVEGKTYRNVIIHLKKTKDNSLHSKKVTVDLNASKTHKEHIIKNKVVEVKQIDKKVNLTLYFALYGLFCLILFLAYRYITKNSILKLFT